MVTQKHIIFTLFFFLQLVVIWLFLIIIGLSKTCNVRIFSTRKWWGKCVIIRRIKGFGRNRRCFSVTLETCQSGNLLMLFSAILSCFFTSDWAELCRRAGMTHKLWWHFTWAVVYNMFVTSERVFHVTSMHADSVLMSFFIWFSSRFNA